jgi:hypothetical protein
LLEDPCTPAACLGKWHDIDGGGGNGVVLVVVMFVVMVV